MNSVVPHLLPQLPRLCCSAERDQKFSAGYQQRRRNLVNYWGAGAVLRWNEIMKLVAKHNIPPYQNDDGTYPVPSAANHSRIPDVSICQSTLCSKGLCLPEALHNMTHVFRLTIINSSLTGLRLSGLIQVFRLCCQNLHCLLSPVKMPQSAGQVLKF